MHNFRHIEYRPIYNQAVLRLPAPHWRSYPSLHPARGIPRHRVIGEWVIDDAVGLVDEFVELEKQRR